MKKLMLACAALGAGMLSANSYAVNCSSIQMWNATDPYNGTAQVQESGKAYTANWWSQGHSPASYSGQWQEWSAIGNCDSDINHPPVALLQFIGAPSFIQPGVQYTVTLDGSRSTDVDGDSLTYSFDDKPFASSASTTTIIGGFFDLCEPMYRSYKLTVKDSKGLTTSVTQSLKVGDASAGNPRCTSSTSRSSSSSVRPSSVSSTSSSSVKTNTAPVAHLDQSVYEFWDIVTIDASNSTDADGDALTYSWSFTSATTAKVTYTSEMPTRGLNITVTVSDGKGGQSTASAILNGKGDHVASTSSTSSSVINGCSSPQYVAGTTYATGQLVQNAGNEYICTVGGWCSSTAAWAYAPGTGTYWTQAWALANSCGKPSSSSSSSAKTSSSISSGCNCSVISSSARSLSSSSRSSTPGRYHVISGYWHNFNNGSGVIPLDQVSNDFDAINVSFAEPTGRAAGEIAFNLDAAFDKTAFKAAIKSKQAAGIKILISIGGANGQVQLPTAAARANFVNSMIPIIDEYGFDGLDVDFEGHSLFLDGNDKDFRAPTTPVIVNLIGALQDLTGHYGSKFMLTMAPETFFVQLGYSFYGSTCNGCDARAGSYLPVIYAMRNQLSWLQVQNYNSGSITGLDNAYHTMGGADFHVAMIDMLLTGFKVAGTQLMFPALRQDQVLLGLPANVNAGGGFTSVADVQSALNCLVKLQGCGSYQPHTTTGYKDLRGLMTWSVNWDKFNNFEFSTKHRQYLDSL